MQVEFYTGVTQGTLVFMKGFNAPTGGTAEGGQSGSLGERAGFSGLLLMGEEGPGEKGRSSPPRPFLQAVSRELLPPRAPGRAWPG